MRFKLAVLAILAALAASATWDPASADDAPARADRRIEMTPADTAVAAAYSGALSKEPVDAAGRRLTILTAKTTYAKGEEIRVLHLAEATKPGLGLYIMGPKIVWGESIDGKLVTPASDPYGGYDGVVLASPGIDSHYEVTVYHLAPGTHTIQWKSATPECEPVHASNVITVVVR